MQQCQKITTYKLFKYCIYSKYSFQVVVTYFNFIFFIRVVLLRLHYIDLAALHTEFYMKTQHHIVYIYFLIVNIRPSLTINTKNDENNEISSRRQGNRHHTTNL